METSVGKELNQHAFFINLTNQKAMADFRSQLWPYHINIDILQTFSTVKPMQKAYLEPSQTSTTKPSCDFSKEALP